MKYFWLLRLMRDLGIAVKPHCLGSSDCFDRGKLPGNGLVVGMTLKTKIWTVCKLEKRATVHSSIAQAFYRVLVGEVDEKAYRLWR